MTIKYETCKTIEGGKEKCALGTLCNSTEIRGQALSSIIKGRKQKKPYYERGEYTNKYPLMIVLPQPSIQDEKVGAIGFGRSMAKLIRFVTLAGIDPKDVFVTYHLKCKTPKRRKATAAEMKTCADHLAFEVEQYEPEVVMALGAPTLNAFDLQLQGGITKIRGKTFTKRVNTQTKEGREVTVIPSVDPDVFSRKEDAALESRLQHDYNKVKEVLEGTFVSDEYLLPYFVPRTLEDVDLIVEKLKEVPFFAFDTETRGLPIFRQPMLCISLCWGETDPKLQGDGRVPLTDGVKSAVIPIYQSNYDSLMGDDPLSDDWKLDPYWSDFKPEGWFTLSPEEDEKKKFSDLMALGKVQEVFNKLKTVFEDPNIAKSAHNVKFDLNVFRQHTGIRIKGFLYDSMLMHHLLHEFRPHDLSYLADIELGVGRYDDDLKDIVGKGAQLKAYYDCIPNDMLWDYAARDADCCYRLTKIYYNRLQKKPHLWKLYQEEVEPASRTLANAEWFGTLIDTDVVSVLRAGYEKDRVSLLTNLKGHTWPEFNPNSQRDVVKVVKDAGFERKIKDENKPNGYTCDKERLMSLADDIPIAEDILKVRNVTKMISTYCDKAIELSDLKGRVRISFFIHGTETGRLSCMFLHQIPRFDKQRAAQGKGNLRDMFIAPEGKSLVYGDYSQIELRILGILAEDEEMLRIYASGGDVHTATAAALTGVADEDVLDFNRQNCGKNVNFGLAYGSKGARLLQTGQWEDSFGVRRPITRDMLDRGMIRFQQRFPGVTSYLADLPDRARANSGVWVTPFGRERHMGLTSDLFSGKIGMRSAAEREMVNFSIQSPAGGIMVRTMNMVDVWLDKLMAAGQIGPEDITLSNTVHDSVTYEVKDELVPWFKQNLQIIAQRPIPELDNHIFPFEMGVGKTWSDAEADSK